MSAHLPIRAVEIVRDASPERVGWVGRIHAAWWQSVAAIIETGKLITAAKRALPHGQFEAMVERDLLFGPRTARMLMCIAADRRIGTCGSALPPSWRTLYELTRLDDDTFAAAVASGSINAEMQRKDIAHFLNGRRDAELRGALDQMARRQIRHHLRRPAVAVRTDDRRR